LAEFAQAVGAGMATFSEKGARRGGKRGAIHYGYTQDEWYDLREAFIKAYLATRRSDGGAELNGDGRRFLEAMASRLSSLSPEEQPSEKEKPR
jgi:hypothetical protein